jgi:acyl-CoA thioesterase FadM
MVVTRIGLGLRFDGAGYTSEIYVNYTNAVRWGDKKQISVRVKKLSSQKKSRSGC